MSLRTRLDLTALEDRTVPAYAVVGVGQIADAAEGGTDGIIEFTRTSTIGSLPVSYTVSGTATSGTDYTALSGTVTFVNGSATVTVSVDALHDGLLDPGQTVTLTVASGSGYLIGINDSATISIIDTEVFPVAFDSWVTTSVNGPIEISVIDLTTSVHGDELTVTALTQGTDGNVVDNSDGTVTYTPDTDFVGEDTFTYTVEDPFGNETTGTITVLVTTVIAPPTSVWTDEEEQVTIDLMELAFDPDGDELTVTGITQGTDGTVVDNADGTVTYTPDALFSGDDSFTYTVEDGDGNVATNTIIVSVGDIDPIALDGSVTTAVNTPANVVVLDIAYDPAGDTLEVTAVTQGAHGTVVIETDGSVTYTPDTSYTGTDTFTYTVEDDHSNTSIGTIIVTVGAVAPGSGDEIIEDLEDVEDELENNYDEDTPSEILATLPALVTTIDSYLADFTSFIDLNSVTVLGSNKPLGDFQPALWDALLRGMYPAYTDTLNTEALLWSILVISKSKLSSIVTQLAATNNPIIAQALFQEYNTLLAVHKAVTNTWEKVDGQLRTRYYPEAAKMWVVATRGLDPNIANLFRPPLPPTRDRADIRP